MDEKMFADEFRDACQKWRSYFASEIEVSGQTVTKARALMYLAETQKELTQKELAYLLCVEEPSVVRMLDGLERDGLVQRRVTSHDKRSKHVFLTAAALPVVAQIHDIAVRVFKKGLAGIADEKLEVAREVFDMISRNIA